MPEYEDIAKEQTVIHTWKTAKQRVDKEVKYQLTSRYLQFSTELDWPEDLPLRGTLGSLSV